MIRVLVVDDEAIAREHAIRLVEKTGKARVIATATNGREALQAIASEPPDVMLLDIEMPELDGLATAMQAPDVHAVFTTAHTRFAVDAFAVNAVDFLLKPLTRGLIERALERVSERIERKITRETRPGLLVADRGRTEYVDVSRIDRFRATDKYTAFSLDGREILIRDSLDTLEQRWSAHGFVRVHRSELVRAQAIVALASNGEAGIATLANGEAVNVGRRRLASVRELLRERSQAR